LWTSGSLLGAQSAPRWCATGAPIDVPALRWTPGTTGPSTDINQYLIVIAMETPADYLQNVLNTQQYATEPFCEEY